MCLQKLNFDCPSVGLELSGFIKIAGLQYEELNDIYINIIGELIFPIILLLSERPAKLAGSPSR